MAREKSAVSKSLNLIASTCMLLLGIACSSGSAFSAVNPAPANPAPEVSKLLNGEVVVNTSALDDGVTGVTAQVYIDASPEQIWRALTDYDNQKHFLPKVVDSGLISDNGSEQVMFQTGRSGVLFFRKTVHVKLRIKGEPLRRLAFQQIEGDFKVYHGEWVIDSASGGRGATLTFRAEIKPDFFAPAFFIRNVQEKDLPMVLGAMKKRAESAGAIGKSVKILQSDAS